MFCFLSSCCRGDRNCVCLFGFCCDRSWCYSEKSKRRTLQKEDIQTAIKYTEIFDFLVDVIQ